MNPRVTAVSPEPGYKLRLTFTNKEVRIYDVTPFLSKGVFRELKDESLFRSVRPWHGSVQWSGGQDICPDALYEDSVPLAGNPALAVMESRVAYGKKGTRSKLKPKPSA